MKLMFEITAEQFAKYKQHVLDNIDSDFYTVNKAVQQAIFSPIKDKTIYTKLHYYLDDLNQHTQKQVTNEILLTRGYMVDEDRQLYSYSTFGGNVWGVVYYNGNPCVFYFGARELLTRMPFLDEIYAKRAKPVIFTPIKRRPKSKPNKKWYEYGMLPYWFHKQKAIRFFRKKNIRQPLRHFEQVVWEKWFDPSFIEAVLEKRPQGK